MEEKTTDVQSNVQTERFQFVLSISRLADLSHMRLNQ